METRKKRRSEAPLVFLLFAAAAIAALAFVVFQRAPEGPPEAVFPLPDRYSGSYASDWGAPRAQGRHEGTDIHAPEGTPIRSITDGTVSLAFGSGDDGWNPLGGYTVMIRAAYGVGPIERGDLLYYAHMNAPTNLKPGETVEAGQKIGEVGATGNGPKETRGRFDPHLHLGWYEGWSFFGQNRAQAESGAMNPYPLLRWIQQNKTRSGSATGRRRPKGPGFGQ